MKDSDTKGQAGKNQDEQLEKEAAVMKGRIGKRRTSGWRRTSAENGEWKIIATRYGENEKGIAAI